MLQVLGLKTVNELRDHNIPKIQGVFVNGLKAVIGLPMHALGLFRKEIVNISITAQPLPDSLGTRELSLPRGLGLRLIVEPVAFAAIETRPAVKYPASPVASRAKKPLSPSTEV